MLNLVVKRIPIELGTEFKSSFENHAAFLHHFICKLFLSRAICNFKYSCLGSTWSPYWDKHFCETERETSKGRITAGIWQRVNVFELAWIRFIPSRTHRKTFETKFGVSRAHFPELLAQEVLKIAILSMTGHRFRFPVLIKPVPLTNCGMNYSALAVGMLDRTDFSVQFVRAINAVLETFCWSATHFPAQSERS